MDFTAQVGREWSAGTSQGHPGAVGLCSEDAEVRGSAELALSDG